jgi:hypothetical protein
VPRRGWNDLSDPGVWEKKKKECELLYQVKFLWQGMEFQVQAFMDTGNFLYEPLEGYPVSIVEKAVFCNSTKNLLKN